MTGADVGPAALMQLAEFYCIHTVTEEGINKSADFPTIKCYAWYL
jgi:hypothetical protein